MPRSWACRAVAGATRLDTHEGSLFNKIAKDLAVDIDVQNGTVSLDVKVRYTETSTEYSAERDIETGEDIE